MILYDLNLKYTGSEIHHLHLGHNSFSKTLHKCQVGWVLFQIILSICLILKFANEDVRQSTL